ncbi:MAG: hypothetical protein WCX73_02840 [Candidatus Pacearchaeota archaeon]|jgi:hypothetical protein
MEIPKEILSIIDRINKSEDNWKAIYMGVWGYYFQLKAKFENTSEWNRPHKLGLPAFRRGYHEYTPNQLCSILTSKDIEITFEHLIILFSLFEELLNKSSEILFGTELDTSQWRNMKKFFEEESTLDILSEESMKELNLAKQTRNCYVHNGGKIDQIWLDSCNKIEEKSMELIGKNLEDGFQNLFHRIEEWHDLIIEATNKIKEKIESK